MITPDPTLTVSEPAKGSATDLSPRIAAVRRFNRFYTRRIGVLGERHANSPFSLTESRVIWELAHRRRATATRIGEELGLDAGYLSRILRRFEQDGLVRRAQSDIDARQMILSLTDRGEGAFAALDAATRTGIGAMLGSLSADGQARLIAAMETIEQTLDPAPAREPFLLRPHGAGDMGWVVHRQSILYAREYGWNAEYESLVSRIVADFLDGFDPARERCWIAERDGRIAGSVFVVKHPQRDGVAKLRLLYVEPDARGLGIGTRLVRECTRFARDTGYRTLTLWTNSVLVSARRLYEAEGYRLVDETPHLSFGKELLGQTWELTL